MNLTCFGISHKTACVETRERFALAESRLPDALSELRAQPGIHEAVILSTCNRVEIYAATDHLHAGPAIFAEWLAQRAGLPAIPPGAAYHHTFPHSALHLFQVASGLDSMMLGETEILGQLKKSYQTAQAAGSTGRFLNKLFQWTFRTAKSVRSRTDITRGSVSVGAAAVELAESIFGKLTGHRALVLGAGETSERVARSLQSRGVASILVSNRSHERAHALAAELNGEAIPFDAWPARLPEVDILITSTAAPHFVVRPEHIRPHLRARQDRPLFLVDIAVPRDVDPAVNLLDGVYLHDLDSLQATVAQSVARRQRETAACDLILREHLSDFSTWFYYERCRLKTGAWMPPRAIPCGQ